MMEDATINIDANEVKGKQEQSDTIQKSVDDQYPFILSTDDLMMELTKLYLNNLNKEKLLGMYTVKLKNAEVYVLQTKDFKKDSQGAIDGLKVEITKLKTDLIASKASSDNSATLEKDLEIARNALVKIKESNRLFDMRNKEFDQVLCFAREEITELKTENKTHVDVNMKITAELKKLTEAHNKLKKVKKK